MLAKQCNAMQSDQIFWRMKDEVTRALGRILSGVGRVTNDTRLAWLAMRYFSANNPLLAPIFFGKLKQHCWMADLLLKRGINSHSAYPFYAQELETANHILLDCVFARQVW
ncbi:hypothetical protein [Oryza sativa Japonica Group]|uniref:Reverse transcriptase zinc-binding domain-containing protein n=1 Tax=Oryza sativa subsp. japonica TaxID=39947 RepID=Q94DG5_ORYSJ|nr:hypothetical protein [Oryza sativa Japonica Group]BAB89858.1 hypothetical protein [Oryza sativa Japonica Group]